ncbi:MAG: hypothetical protein ABIM99_06280 [Candidatus Dojkabacteria bacterium]
MKFKFFIFIFSIVSLLSISYKVSAVVTSPPTLVAPLPLENTDPMTPTPTQPTAQPPANIVEPTPAKPPTPSDQPAKGSGSSGSSGVQTIPQNKPVPTNLSNYDIFGNNSSTPDLRIFILCCICLLGLLVIAVITFIVVLHKKKKMKMNK